MYVRVPISKQTLGKTRQYALDMFAPSLPLTHTPLTGRIGLHLLL